MGSQFQQRLPSAISRDQRAITLRSRDPFQREAAGALRHRRLIWFIEKLVLPATAPTATITISAVEPTRAVKAITAVVVIRSPPASTIRITDPSDLFDVGHNVIWHRPNRHGRRGADVHSAG